MTHAASAGNYGNLVIIEHGYGIETKFAHASKLLVQRGQRVDHGQNIALGLPAAAKIWVYRPVPGGGAA